MATAKRQRLSGGGVTIRDVAARAGVSTMTVSRVINSEANVRDATRERVQNAIRELSFAPNPAAQRLAAARSMKIALLYDNPSAGFLSEFLLGALEGAAGAQLVVLNHKETEPAATVVETVLRAGAEGAVLPPPLSESDEVIDQLRKAGVEVVAVAPGRPSAVMPTLRIDNERAARDIADHLLGLGHRRFAFIGGHPNQSVSDQRREGFVGRLAEAGIPPADIRVEPGLFTYKSGLEAAERILGGDAPPTAIFAANDDMAAATLALAHRRGIDVPRDLSVVGFDDTPIAEAISPSLTTIRQPVAAMAEEAVRVLSELLKRRDSAPGDFAQQELDYALIVRESTGPAPRR